MSIKSCYSTVVSYMMLSLFSLTAGTVSGLDKLPVIPGLVSIILKQRIPEGSNISRSFYANNVQLEPFSIILCGKKVGQKDGSIKYTKVPAEAIRHISFYTQNDLELDEKYNPGNHIPVIGSASRRASGHYNKPDRGEPLFSKEQADRRRVLLAYTENSNYFRFYQQKGFYLGGTSPKFPVMSFFSGGGNECYSEQRPGVGETVVRLYLLATKGLSDTKTLEIYASARMDDKEKRAPEEEGPLKYSMPKSPALQIEDLNVSRVLVKVGSQNHGNFYSYFSTLVKSEKRYGVIEQKGLRVCRTLMGAPFHHLFKYTDDPRKCNINNPDYFIEKHGSTDCLFATCKRTISLSAISSKKIPFTDMFSGDMVIGGSCANKSMGTGGGLVLKPLLNGTRASLSGNGVYESLKGGVGAYFYVRKNKKDTFRPITRGAEAGKENVFYFYSYQWGIDTAGLVGIGSNCKWNQEIRADGHDRFGNWISISFRPALGEGLPVITGVSS